MTGVTPLPQPPVGSKEPWATHNRELAGYTQRFLTVLIQGMQRLGAPVVLPTATVSQLTADPAVFRPTPPRMVFCTDLSSTSNGAPVYSDNLVWRRFSDDSVVS